MRTYRIFDGLRVSPSKGYGERNAEFMGKADHFPVPLQETVMGQAQPAEAVASQSIHSRLVEQKIRLELSNRREHVL